MSATTNTSASGGYILDRRPFPAGGREITAALQLMVSNLTGLPGRLVRPRWQPTPPVTPAADVNWASIGITQVEADDYPVIIHDGATTLPGAPGPGVDRMQRHVTLTVVTSLYGPECEDLSGMLRDALYIPQNVEPLREFGLKLYEVRDLARNAEIVNQQWIDRIDIAIMMRRQVDRVYPVLNITGADVQFFNEAGLLMEVQV